MSSKEIGETTPRGAVEKSRAEDAAKTSWIKRVILFFQQVLDELKKVTTPTRKELINFTLVVLAFVVIMMAFVWLMDQLWGWLMLFIFGTPGF